MNAGLATAGQADLGRADPRQTTSSAIREEVTSLFVALREQVYRQTLRVVRIPAEAEDITQEAFLRLYVHRRKGARIENPRAWLIQIAYNLAIDRIRAARGVTLMGEESARFAWVEDSSPVLDDVLVEQEKRRSVHRALEELSPQERRCMDLRVAGLRYREIAAVLGVRISTVQTNLARAIRKIVAKLDV